MGQDFGDVGNLAADAMTLGATAGMRGARAQGDAAMASLAQQQADRALALKYAEPSPEELAQLNRGIALNEAEVARKEKILASSDPAVIEAGQQALKLLRGEEAKTLGPLKSNIAKQESALREKLLAQLGSGYENTTAGIQALNAFNEQANNALSAAQQNSLGQLLGVAQDSSARYGTESNAKTAGGLASLFGNINNRRISAITGAPITNAGAPFVGDIAGAAANQQFVGNAIKVGGIVASGGLSGMLPSGGGAGATAGAGNPYTFGYGVDPKYAGY